MSKKGEYKNPQGNKKNKIHACVDSNDYLIILVASPKKLIKAEKSNFSFLLTGMAGHLGRLLKTSSEPNSKLESLKLPTSKPLRFPLTSKVTLEER